MAKSFALLFISILSLSSAMPRDIIPDRLTDGSSNYADNIAFITGLLTAYTGSPATIPATCFDDVTQNQLNADLGGFMLQIVAGNVSKATQQLKVFITDLVLAQYNCGLNLIPQNLVTDYNSKGGFYLLVNILHSTRDIKETVYDIISLINTEQWGPAGTEVGNLMQILVPLPTLQALQATSSNFGVFSYGLLNGLEGTTTNPGKCYEAFMTAGQEYTKVESAFINAKSKSISGIFQFAQSLEEFLPYMTPLKTQCDWAGLESQIQGVFDGGFKAFLMRYYNNLNTITADFKKVMVCSSNYQECGSSWGEMIRILFNWNLSQPALNLDSKSMEWEDLITFVQGLGNGLEGSDKQGACYGGLSNAGSTFLDIVSDVVMFKEGDWSAVTELFTNLDVFIPQVKAIDEVCEIEGLLQAVDNLFKPDGYKPFFVRYYKNLQLINAQIYHVVHCNNDYYLCGSSLGNTVDLLFNWSLN